MGASARRRARRESMQKTNPNPNVVEFRTNEPMSLADSIIGRSEFARRIGQTFGGKRDWNEALGYVPSISATDYRNRYERGGLAARIVECFAKATWRGRGELMEDEDPNTHTEFESAWTDLNTRLSIWKRFQDLDILTSLGEFAAMFIGAPGDYTQELERGNRQEEIGYLRLVSQENISIQSYEDDLKNPRFAMPKTYSLKLQQSGSARFVDGIHWSRIIHTCEGALDSTYLGMPVLQRVWNLLDDLMKVTGGGSEAFWIRANQGLLLTLDKEMKDIDPEELAEMRKQADLYKHGMDRIIRARGLDAKTLGSDVANFSDPADAIITQIAGARGIPKRILVGSEMGQLASTQDADNWDSQIMDRQTSYAEPMFVRQFADRLIYYGYLPQPKQYRVVWPEVDSLSETEKAQGAKIWADVNHSAGEVVFTSDEIRDQWAGKQPLEDSQKRIHSTPIVVTPPVTAAQKAALAIAARKRRSTRTKRVWVTKGDNTCPECYEMEGEEVGMGSSFSNGLDSPPVHPNCNCEVVLVDE